MQESREFVASEPLIIRLEARWPPVRFYVADLPVIILRRNVGGLEHVTHIGVPRDLIGIFQDEILHFLLYNLTVEGPLLAKFGRRLTEPSGRFPASTSILTYF
jgi:hypothetical protein